MRWSGRPRQPTGWGRRSWSAERCPGGDSSLLPANGSRRSARAPAHVRGHIAFLSSLLGQGCGCFPAGSCGLQLLHPVAAGLALQGGSIEETPGLPPRHSTVRSVAVACSPAISPVRLVKKTASRVRTTPAASWTGGFARSRPQAHGFSLQHRVGSVKEREWTATAVCASFRAGTARSSARKGGRSQDQPVPRKIRGAGPGIAGQNRFSRQAAMRAPAGQEA
jgi:hypothetical protein